MWSPSSPPGSGASNRRGAAIRWGVWKNVADPGRVVGGFVIDSWIERQCGHVPVTNAGALDRGLLNDFNIGEQPPNRPPPVAASIASLSEGT
ncbi:hypothetical protein AGR3A_Lc140123 [Agrobacterium tomkonis CFBP 6623]|uniref:Uncharacterized protein n=1 Tax=Agrobacterium tomkonis CFBP 6623 TaxID=1183432 RepID=A0A1S7RMP2_9HYPH|nr:hypothetical protein AGR3A_Lc140123 [Agrobacterium tomkonis CFBP 6623]